MTYDENIKLKSGIVLLGGGAGQTILDGGGRGENLIDASLTRDSVVKGFTLRNVGQAEGCADPSDPLLCSGDWYRAALYMDQHPNLGCITSIEVTENSFEDNDIGIMFYFQPGGSVQVHDNRFLDNRAALVANHHGDGAGDISHNLFFGSEYALMLQASYLNVTHNIIAESGTVLTQEYIQEGELACNLLYDYQGLGERLVLGHDNNVEAEQSPFVSETLTLSPDALTPGCVNASGGPILPGPSADLSFEP